MKRESIDTLSFDDCGVEEIDLTEGAMYKRAFKKFYNMKDTIVEDEENDCQDIENEDVNEEDLEVEEKDTEIEEEDSE